jgi:hypothetical protein
MMDGKSSCIWNCLFKATLPTGGPRFFFWYKSRNDVVEPPPSAHRAKAFPVDVRWEQKRQATSWQELAANFLSALRIGFRASRNRN